MCNLYTTSAIAEFLNTDRRNIHYYIKKNHLQATMIDGDYEIKEKDYHDFLDNYYNTDARFSNRGIAKKLTDEQVFILSEIITDTQNNNISLTEFNKKYEEKTHLVPQIKEFIIYKRDKCIRYDFEERGCRQQPLADKYNLKLVTIKTIVNQYKERSDF